MKKNYIIGFLICIICIAGFFRYYQNTELPPGLYPDEAMNGNNALEAIQKNDYKLFYPENNGREGLFINIQAFFLNIFMDETGIPEPWMLRFASGLFGIGTVIGMYFLMKELLKGHPYQTEGALLAAFLVATSFWHINFSRIGFRAIMAPFFFTWGTWGFIKTLWGTYKNKITGILSYICFGIIFGLGFHSYIAYRATPAILFCIFLFAIFSRKKDWKKIIIKTLWFGLGACIAFAPLGIYFVEHPEDFFGRTSQISVFSSPTPLKDLGINIAKTIWMFFGTGDGNWRHNLAGKAELFLPVALLFAYGIYASFKNIKKYPLLFITACSSLCVMALPVVISNEGIPHALRAIIMIPGIFILASWGGISLYTYLNEKIGKKKIWGTVLKISIPLLCVACIVDAYLSYFILWGKNQETKWAFTYDFVQLARMLNILPQNAQKYVIVDAGGTLVHGIPMPAMTTMFLTHAYLKEDQAQKNLFFITKEERANIPEGALTFYIR